MKIKFFIMILITLNIVFLLNSESVKAGEPLFDITICTESNIVNPGDNITFYVYFIGVGNVTKDYLLGYVNSDVYFEKV